MVFNKKRVIDAIDKLNKREKAISICDFSTLYTELLFYKLLIVLNNLADFCFGRGENKYITISGNKRKQQ